MKIEVNDYTKEQLEAMSIEQLEEHVRALYEAGQLLKAEQREVAAVLNAKETDANLAIKLGLAKLSPAEAARAKELLAKAGAKTTPDPRDQTVSGSNMPKEDAVRSGG